MKNKRELRDPSARCEVDLPAVITSIQPQKKNRNRFSLFHQEHFILGLSSHSLLRFKLTKGVEITDTLFSRIVSEEQFLDVKDYLYRLLGRRDHSRDELRTKALQKGYESKQVEDVLEELELKDLIDDESFARKYIADKLSLQQWGPVKIRIHLLKKGISGSVIQHAMDEQTRGLQLHQICVDLAIKHKLRFLREKDGIKRKQKIMKYLQRKGFQYDTINRALPEILNRLNV
ncbi:MAG: regulatory protein RecX [Balneolaceae bacterium]